MLTIPSYSSHYAHLMLKWRKTSLLSWQFFEGTYKTDLLFPQDKRMCWDPSITNNNIMAISTWTANWVWSIDELKQILVSSSQGLMQHIPYVNGSCCLRHLTYCLELVQNTATHLEFLTPYNFSVYYTGSLLQGAYRELLLPKLGAGDKAKIMGYVILYHGNGTMV